MRRVPASSKRVLIELLLCWVVPFLLHNIMQHSLTQQPLLSNRRYVSELLSADSRENVGLVECSGTLGFAGSDVFVWYTVVTPGNSWVCEPLTSLVSSVPGVAWRQWWTLGKYDHWGPHSLCCILKEKRLHNSFAWTHNTRTVLVNFFIFRA